MDALGRHGMRPEHQGPQHCSGSDLYAPRRVHTLLMATLSK